MNHTIEQIATTLDAAARTAMATQQVSHAQKITLADAYAIQKASIQLRLDRGEILTGYKLGFTSKAKMEQMGVHDIIWGRLTNQMEIASGGKLHTDACIHPRAEPEIAFKTKKRIHRKIKLEEVNDFVEAVAGAIEVIDSRYENFKFSLEDVVADNCSSRGYVIGDWYAPETRVQNLEIKLKVNGEVVQAGNSNAIFGNPLESLVEISKMMVRYNCAIEAGQIVLAGAATSAVYVHSGDQIEAQFDRLGTVSMGVE